MQIIYNQEDSRLVDKTLQNLLMDTKWLGEGKTSELVIDELNKFLL